MATIPLAVLILFVIGIMGGPAAFLHTVSLWTADLVHYVVAWIKSL
jgi:hypothetical protein